MRQVLDGLGHLFVTLLGVVVGLFFLLMASQAVVDIARWIF